eukprot:4588199-Amphidinium_carterae.1
MEFTNMRTQHQNFDVRPETLFQRSTLHSCRAATSVQGHSHGGRPSRANFIPWRTKSLRGREHERKRLRSSTTLTRIRPKRHLLRIAVRGWLG